MNFDLKDDNGTHQAPSWSKQVAKQFKQNLNGKTLWYFFNE